MEIHVLNIQPLPRRHSVEVWMLIGNRKCHFRFTRRVKQLANRQLEIISYENTFEEMFRFNPEIVNRVIDLVRKFDKGKQVKLPDVVGNFDNSRQASVSRRSCPFEIDM